MENTPFIFIFKRKFVCLISCIMSTVKPSFFYFLFLQFFCNKLGLEAEIRKG